MFKKKLMPIVLAILVFGTFTGCTARQTPTPTPQGYTGTPKNIVKNIEKTVIPPAQLAAMEANAEGIINDVDAKNWKKVDSRLNQIKTSYNQALPLLQVSGIAKTHTDSITNAINSLTKHATAKKAYETKLEANKITKHLADIANNYKMIIPADAGRLGYLIREVVLNVEGKDWTAAKTNYDSAKTIWTSLRTTLKTTYKNDADKFTTEFDNLGRAIMDKSVTGVKKYAKLTVDRLIVLKNDFAKQNATK